ncbi:hypothetical protein AB0B25_08175 [Nocardia sp. NPDC049190]|uniref:hypothetical protein n=1 Tax=Nocardia sp. NPDC049190 TaxID=3155650 RepID=UPI0033D30DE9
MPAEQEREGMADFRRLTSAAAGHQLVPWEINGVWAEPDRFWTRRPLGEVVFGGTGGVFGASYSS